MNRYGMGLVSGVVLGGVLAAAWSARAAGTELDSDARVFPYNGTLERNGAAYTGQVDLRFTVTDDASCTFNEDHPDVTVYSGRFAVNIGALQSSGVPACVFNAQRVYVQVGVRDATSTGSYTTLSGRQRVRPVPFALWSAEGNNFSVDGNLTAAQNATVGGSATVGGGVTAATGAFTGAVTAGSVTANSGQVLGNTVRANTSVTAATGTYSGAVTVGSLASTGTVAVTTGNVSVGTGNVAVTTGNVAVNTGNITVSSGNLSLSNGTVTANGGSATTVASLSSTGNSAEVSLANGRSGSWRVGVGGGTAGANDLSFFNTASGVNRMVVENDGDVSISGNLTVGGTVTHTTQCPGSPYFSANKDSGKSRLCVYRSTVGRTWREAVRYCWDEVHGSQLCTMAQVRIACMSGMPMTENMWLADRAVDDEAFEVNTTNCDNFDGDVSQTDSNGAYCCHFMRAD